MTERDQGYLQALKDLKAWAEQQRHNRRDVLMEEVGGLIAVEEYLDRLIAMKSGTIDSGG